MQKFHIRFRAKRRGAIGAFESFEETIDATSFEAMKIGLYDNYEHITIFEVNGCAVPTEQR